LRALLSDFQEKFISMETVVGKFFGKLYGTAEDGCE
jgi:hypothetical protein